MSAGASARLFVALWPDARVRAALADAAAQWVWPPGAVRMRAERLHLTLHFLGNVERERMPELGAALALRSPPFVLTLSRPTLWPGGTAVLEPQALSPELAELHAALGAALRRLALPTEARAFRPHVTLARRAAGTVAPAEHCRVEWPVAGHALVESRQPGGYRVVRHYPASAAAGLERGQHPAGAAGVE